MDALAAGISAARLATAGLAVLASALVYVVVKGYRARRVFYQLRAQGMPMPPWSPLLGHLLTLPPITSTLPPDAQQPDAFSALAHLHSPPNPENDDPAAWDGALYLDLHPFASPMLVLCSPHLAVQACQTHDLPKPPILHAFFTPLAGGPDNLFTANGAAWRRSRALFNPGFNPAYLLQEQTGHVVDEAEVYVEMLRAHARRGDLFPLDDATCWYAMDIIGSATLDARLHSQRGPNPLASAMRRQIRWHVLDNEWNLFRRWNPARPFVQWYNNRQMDGYIGRELDKRYAEWKAGGKGGEGQETRSVIHLALASYMAEREGELPEKLDAGFRRWATVQIRLFLFAGHDSTSSTICYCFYLLHKHPAALARLMAEHDAVFGADLATTATQIRASPHLLNALPYTTGVIKEALRLFPPASAMRGGDPSVVLTGASGKRYPTAGTNIWVLHSAVHRHPSWVRPDDFLPERWLAAPGDPLYPPKGGWRPFEHGPRNCLGQTLAMLDVKVTLALVVREMEVRGAYDEWDAQRGGRRGVKEVRGERAYQTQAGGAHPADGFPCRVRFREGRGFGKEKGEN